MSKRRQPQPPPQGPQPFAAVLADEIAEIAERRRQRAAEGAEDETPPDAAAPPDGAAAPSAGAADGVPEGRTSGVAGGAAPAPETATGHGAAGGGEPDYGRAFNSDLVGLSFSGGGIRSATFNLGVLQGLADLKLLDRFDYLSTVSGGGYIGSWLTGLLQRQGEGEAQGTGEGEGEHGGGVVGEVEKALASDRSSTQPAIRWLRQYSNYLTPKVGIITADTWAVVTTYLRNLVLNLLLLVSAFAAILLLPRGWHWLAARLPGYAEQLVAWVRLDLSLPLMWLALPLAALAVAVMGYHMASFLEKGPADGSQAASSRLLGAVAVQLTIVLPLLLAAGVGAVWLKQMGRDLVAPEQSGGAPLTQAVPWLRALAFGSELGGWIVGTALAYTAAWSLSWVVAGILVQWRRHRAEKLAQQRLASPSRWWRMVVAAPACGAVGGLLLYLYGRLVGGLELWGALTWGPALIVVGFILVAALQTGLAGPKLHDYQREWLSRVAAWLLIYSFGWIAIFGVAVYGTVLAYWLAGWARAGASAGWIGTTVGGILASRGGGDGKAGLARTLLAKVAPYVFIVGLLLHLAVGIDRTLSWMAEKGREAAAVAAVEGEAGGAVAAQAGEPVAQPAGETGELARAGGGAGGEAASLEPVTQRSGSSRRQAPQGDDQASADEATGMGAWGRFLAVRSNWLEERTVAKEGGGETEPAAAAAGVGSGFDLSLQLRVARGEGAADEEERGLFARLLREHHALLEEHRALHSLLLFAGLVALLALVGWRVDVNEFSMHRLYRNRLVRCYLGASVEPGKRSRQRQPFTGFYPEDDVPLAELGRRPHPGPYPIVNTALNLVAGDELAWQERKAASFVFTPRYCGFEISPDDRAYRGTFVCPCDDGDRSREGYGRQPKELYLGGAMAISGAAASPNMGFRSSAALAFLLTVFNVRLGWWLGSPKGEKWWRSGPRFAPLHLLAEVFGLTGDRRDYVYLSDGGHFENLGIYELVRRRCRFIVACDAGADPELAFDDLGNAVRKCRTDLGVEITIRTEQIRRGEDGVSRWHCAVGKIDYGRDVGEGVLLYLKSSLTGDEPEDVLNYAQVHPQFPHESTGDQWFDESQFESYRRLGLHVVKEVLEEQVELAKRGDGLVLEELVVRLRQRWLPPPPTAGRFSRHGSELEEVFQRLRESPQDLGFLDAQFYPEWNSLLHGKPSPEPPSWLPGSDEERRQGFYFCNSLIQLMENVYLDLNLEQEYDHPDNGGWMNLFKHWSWSGMFQATWAVSAATYGHRFQSFCQQRLGLDCLGCVEAVELAQAGRGAGARALQAEAEAAPELNFLEKRMVNAFLEPAGSAAAEGARRDLHADPAVGIDRVFALQVVVKSPFPSDGEESEADKREMRFGCGFALAQGQRLVCLRIQDHLRKMGLGRAALSHLYGEHHLTETPVLAPVPDLCAGDFTAEGKRKVLELFRSVSREVQEERSSAARRKR